MNKNEDMKQFIEIGNIIRNRREALNLTQLQIAEYVGVTKSAISRWETGELKNIGGSKIKKLSEILKISPTVIVRGDEPENKEPENVIPYKTKKIPMLGITAAGEPLLVADQYCEYYVEVDENINVDYCLKIKGDSMIDARIQDGDIVFFHQQPIVENGEIAVIAIDGEVTLKRFYKTDEGVILKPENSNYQPMFYTEEDFKEIRVLGKAIFFQSNISN